MPARPIAIAIAAVVLSTGSASAATGQVAGDSTTLRPTDVLVTIVNDTHYDGTYRASGISSVCGKLDYMMPHRNDSFHIEFPDSAANMPVNSVSFDADTLPVGAATNSYYLSVSIRTPSGGSPPSFVVRANRPQFNEPGTVTRSGGAGIDSLTLVGIATKGTRVNVTMTIVCHPRP